MNSNPYEAPVAEIHEADLDNRVSIPEEVSKRIRNAVGAGVISGIITLLVCLAAIVTGHAIMGLDAWSLLDVAMILGLTFGLYKKSRVCAVLMLLYYAGNKIFQVLVLHNYGGIIWGVIFCYLYAMGVAGTFEYHRIMNEAEES